MAKREIETNRLSFTQREKLAAALRSIASTPCSSYSGLSEELTKSLGFKVSGANVGYLCQQLGLKIVMGKRKLPPRVAKPRPAAQQGTGDVGADAAALLEPPIDPAEFRLHNKMVAAIWRELGRPALETA